MSPPINNEIYVKLLQNIFSRYYLIPKFQCILLVKTIDEKIYGFVSSMLISGLLLMSLIEGMPG